MKLALTNFSMKRPWAVVAIAAALAVTLAWQMPKVHFDNDPENMLSPEEPVRVFHHQIKEKFDLYDFVIVGVVNESHQDGVFNVDTLGRIHDLTGELVRLRQTDAGLPAVTTPARDGRSEQTRTLDLEPDNWWLQALNFAFRHNPNRLFDENGDSAIIAREIISPSVVDNIKQAELGSLKIEYLMEEPPANREAALTIRDDAMANPLYKGTLISEDQKAVCLYIPIKDKTFSYNVANLARALTADWPAEDQVFITGLPVAEDTFGVEMLIQMAVSAPLAGVAIFLLLLLFFRRLSLIIAPMVVAVVSIVCTMGLLIGLGYDVHIMSSMIAIFLMPIAVADSVHILSEFFDTYPRFKNKRDTLRHVVGHLFAPMLYTSLTTMAGFASLGTTPIPPVQVFGLHVAFGVGLAWLLTITLIPAYIILWVPERSLERLAAPAQQKTAGSAGLNRLLETLGSFSYRRFKLILALTVAAIAVAAYGISRINVNDNPVKWFTTDHEIRIADQVLNDHFGGTYTAYLTFSAPGAAALDPTVASETIARRAETRFGAVLPDAAQRFAAAIDEARNAASDDPERFFELLTERAAAIDEDALAGWFTLADEVNYLDPEDLTFENLSDAVNALEGVDASIKTAFLEELADNRALAGDALLERALAIADRYTARSFEDFVYAMRAELAAPLFKQPAMLEWVQSLQRHLAENPVVGKTSSAVDALKKANFELTYVAPPIGESEARADIQRRNEANYAVPDSPAAVGQVFTQLEGMKKKDSLFHLISRDYRELNLWIQLKSGDNQDMERVVADVDAYLAENPPPSAVESGWAGLTYINVVWQDKMVRGMLSALGSSFVVVLLMMVLLFRSVIFGLLSMIPLTVTISLIYGIIGLVGKDYDMPVAVLSALTLGLSIDFAIHFLQRSREMVKAEGSWRQASAQMFKEPAMAISRNAITISIGFTPLLLAPLVPYKTVGFFLATIMAVSWAATLFILPAMLTLLRRIVFKKSES